MLTILLGLANTGKSSYILERLAHLGDSSAQVLIVPDHTSHLVELDVCHACGDGASRHVQVLGFHRLCDRVLELSGGAANVTLDAGGKLLLLQKALGEVAPALNVYRKPSQKPAFLEQMLAVLDELRSYAVTPEQLSQVAEPLQGITRDKLLDLSLLYSAYNAKLHRDGFDARDKMTKLCDLLEPSGFLTDKDIFLDGFTYFTAQELQAISIMLRQGRSVTITLLGDLSGNAIFDATVKTVGALERLAKEAGCQCFSEVLETEVTTPLAHLQHHSFGDTATWDEPQTQISVSAATTLYEEVEQTAAAIRQLVSQGARYRDISIVARNMADYEATIQTVLSRYEIPAYISRRSDILEKPALSLVTGVLSAIAGGFGYEEMFRYLKTGLSGLSMEQCDVLENYVLRWEIEGQMWLSDAPWTANPDGFGAPQNERQEQALAEINALRDLVRTPLAPLVDGLKNGDTAAQKVLVLYQFLQTVGLQQALEAQMEQQASVGRLQDAEETAQLWDVLCNVLDQMVETIGDEVSDLDSFASLLRLLLTQYSIGTIPVSLDQVSVSEITRNDRHRVPHVFFLGANDSVLPSVGQSGGILNQDDRQALSQQGVCLSPSGMEQMGLELLLIYTALAQATQSLTLSYPQLSAGGGQLRPAFIVERILGLFPTLITTQDNGTMDYRTVAPIPALEMAGRDPNGSLWQHFKATQNPHLSAMERARTLGRGKLSRKSVEGLYGKVFRMSASRAERLRGCHFAYFMEYGLRAKPRQIERFDAPQIGSFLHFVLEQLAQDVAKRGGFAEVEQAEISQLVDGYVDTYAQEVVGDLALKSPRFRYLFGRLRTTVDAVVEQVAQELKTSDFVPMAFELGFGGDGDLPAVTLSIDDATLQINGKVDRVDGWVKDDKLYLRVVDYKSGKKAFDLASVVMGLDIQLLVYLFALQRSGQQHFGQNIVPAGALYFPVRDSIISAKRSISPADLQKERDKELRRTGMLLRDHAVLKAMEHTALTAPRYLPIKVDKEGNVNGSLASAEQLGQLGAYVEKILKEVATEVRDGNITADPWAKNENDTFCRYCDWADACHFKEGSGGDCLRHIPSISPEAFWQEVTGEEVPS
ncbi:PD-(D/E)XK nuclease family protein [Bengtsoniella intestinalis]|uniref:PD-(D/E)XK nuclease family protein n=1 Tax=Bengtsoniella intestinalis TaxID=3073143 RepID=UPI00391EE622